jgi:hypothetical protein
MQQELGQQMSSHLGRAPAVGSWGKKSILKISSHFELVCKRPFKGFKEKNKRIADALRQQFEG